MTGDGRRATDDGDDSESVTAATVVVTVNRVVDEGVAKVGNRIEIERATGMRTWECNPGILEYWNLAPSVRPSVR